MRGHRSQVECEPLLVRAADAIASLFQRFLGKGPARWESHWAGDDLLVVVLEGGYTVAERTLYESGRGEAVQRSRNALHQALAGDLKAAVEESTGRQVLAFMGASHQEPDLSVELFLLTPGRG